MNASLRSAYDYNMTKKGQLYPVKTVGEALEAVPAKFPQGNGPYG